MATAAAITSPSSSISNVAGSSSSSNTAASKSSLLNIASTSASTENDTISPSSASTSVALPSTSSRSRRNKPSHYYHTPGSATAGPSYSAGDTKSMFSSSNGSGSSKTSAVESNSSSSSKSKSSQRKWKEDTSFKSSGSKWKTAGEHADNNDGDGKSSKWKTATASEEKLSKLNNSNLYKMIGMKWKAFMDNLPENDDASEEDDETVLRLDQADMGLYGLCPETDPFCAVICDICNRVVKPQALEKHVSQRHHGGHGSNHNSQQALHHHHHNHPAPGHHHHHHRQLLSGYTNSSLHTERASAAAATSTDQNSHSSSQSLIVSQSGSAPPSSTITSHERYTEKVSAKSSTRESSPGHRIHNHHSTIKTSSSTSAHSSSSSSSKSKTKSTSKVKSKSSKSGRSVKSSASSSTAPSPSSSSSSSLSGINSSRVPVTATATSTTPSTSTSNGIAIELSTNCSSTIATTAGSTSSSTSRTSVNLMHANQKHSRTSVLSGGNSSSYFPSTSRSSSPSKSSSAQHKIGNHIEPITNKHTTSSSSSPSSTVVLATNSSIGNSSTSSANTRRTYGRCKSSSIERKTVPVKEREYDANKHCGVISSELSRPCTRSLTCKAHSLSSRRMVAGRSKSFDKLLADHRATRELPQTMKQSRTLPELESSNSSSSLDMDRRSVSSNSNLSVEVQASSTTSSQSSVTAATPVETVTTPIIQPSTSSSSSASSMTRNNSLIVGSIVCENMTSPQSRTVLLFDDPNTTVTETVETVNEDDSIQININPDGSTLAIRSSGNNRRNNQNPSQLSIHRNSESQHTLVTTQLIDTTIENIPPELLDDSKFQTNIFSPESTVLSGPIRLLAEDDNLPGASKRLRIEPEPEIDMSNMSEERKLQVMVQRKVSKKNKILFRDPTLPGLSAITIPSAAEILAQAFAEENPNATLTDAQVIMDPETNVVSVSVCGTLNPQNMQLNWAPFNEEFVNNTLTRALAPFGVENKTVRFTREHYMQPRRRVVRNRAGDLELIDVPAMTEEEYNQMISLDGDNVSSMDDSPEIKSEIKLEVIDMDTGDLVHQNQPILPMINIEEIKTEIKDEPSDDGGPNITPRRMMKKKRNQYIGDMAAAGAAAAVRIPDSPSDESIAESLIVNEVRNNIPWHIPTENYEEGIQNATVTTEDDDSLIEPMSLGIDYTISSDSDIDLIEPIASFLTKSPDHSSVSSGKENTNCDGDERVKGYPGHDYYGSDDSSYQNSGANNFYYGRLPKPNHINTFGLVKLRGGTNFRKNILCARRSNSSIHAYQTLFQGGQAIFFRRDNNNTKHCTNDSNGTMNGNGILDMNKNQNFNITSGNMTKGNSISTNISNNKTGKQTRRQNSNGSPNSPAFKRQFSHLYTTSNVGNQASVSPFYRRYNATNSSSKVRLQKRSIIMHVRGNGSGQHLSKTCAILQSQIVNKLAEQLLGFKRICYHRNVNNEHIVLPGSVAKGGSSMKQPNCKLSSSNSSLSTLIHKSNSNEINLSALQSSTTVVTQISTSTNSSIKNSRPSLITGLVSSCNTNNNNNNNNNNVIINNNNNNNFVKISSATLGITNRIPSTNNTTITQRFSSTTPIAVVAPLITTNSSLSSSTTASSSALIQNNSLSLSNSNNSLVEYIRAARNPTTYHRQNSSATSSSSLITINGVVVRGNNVSNSSSSSNGT